MKILIYIKKNYRFSYLYLFTTFPLSYNINFKKSAKLTTPITHATNNKLSSIGRDCYKNG